MKYSMILALLCVGCFDTAVPLGNCAEAVEAEAALCDVDMASGFEEVAILSTERDGAVRDLADRDDEIDRLNDEIDRLDDLIRVKNYVMAQEAWGSCEVWLTEALDPGDLCVVDTSAQ